MDANPKRIKKMCFQKYPDSYVCTEPKLKTVDNFFWDTLYENLDMLHLVPNKDRFCNAIAEVVALTDTSIQSN